MLNKNKINKIHSLRSDGFSMRKIAKRLRISKDTVLKYTKSPFPVKKILPVLEIGVAEVTGDVTKNAKDIDWDQLFEDEPRRGISARGISSEFSNNYDTVQDYYYDHDDRLPRRRGIRFGQPYMESNYYPEELNRDAKYVRPRMPGIPVMRIKHGTVGKSILQIIREGNDQKQKHELQSLLRKFDRIYKSERDKREFEKKLREMKEQTFASDQNKKPGSDNLDKIPIINQDNKIGSISHLEEQQKTKKSIEQKKFTNHTYKDKNITIHDSNNDKSAVIGTGMISLLLAKGFEGLSTGIGGFIGQGMYKIYKTKHKVNPPKKVELCLEQNDVTPKKDKVIPCQKAKIIHPQKAKVIHSKKVFSREINKNQVKLIPID